MKRKTVIAALLIITMMIAGCEGTVNTAGISETAGQEAEGMEETSGTDKEETVEEGEVKDAKEYKDPTEDELKEKLEAEIVGDILVFSYDDYDKDGIHEAFAITGEIAESDFIADDIMKGNVYYIDSDEVTNASELTEKEVDPLEFFILDDTEDYVIDIGPDEANDPGSPKFFAPLYARGTVNAWSFVYGVSGGTVYESNISDKGAVYCQDNGEVWISFDKYDARSDGTGHTYKPYYFCYDPETREFNEFVADEISPDEFGEYEASEDILSVIEEAGGEVTDILKRENGIININYSIQDEYDDNTTDYHNTTVMIEDNKAIMLKAVYSAGERTEDLEESDYFGSFSVSFDEACNDGSSDLNETQGEEEYEGETVYIDFSDCGVILNFPDYFEDVTGIFTYSGTEISSGSGIYNVYLDYSGVSRDWYVEAASNGEPEQEDLEYISDRSINLVDIYVIDEGREALDIIDFLKENFGADYREDSFTLIKKVGEYSFYRCDQIREVENAQNLDPEYLEEFKKFNGAVDLIYDISEYFEPAKPSDDLVGKKLEFETTDIDGNKITSEEIFAENEYTMLNIWATWCGYCVRELPELEAINERISGKNCAVVGLLGDGETDETIKSGKALLDEAGVTYLNILPWEGALSKDLQIEAWPTTFYVDKDGVITDTVIVGAETDKYEPAIDSLLKKNKK